jgi:hypothetical protein
VRIKGREQRSFPVRIDKRHADASDIDSVDDLCPRSLVMMALHYNNCFVAGIRRTTSS